MIEGISNFIYAIIHGIHSIKKSYIARNASRAIRSNDSVSYQREKILWVSEKLSSPKDQIRLSAAFEVRFISDQDHPNIYNALYTACKHEKVRAIEIAMLESLLQLKSTEGTRGHLLLPHCPLPNDDLSTLSQSNVSDVVLQEREISRSEPDMLYAKHAYLISSSEESCLAQHQKEVNLINTLTMKNKAMAELLSTRYSVKSLFLISSLVVLLAVGSLAAYFVHRVVFIDPLISGISLIAGCGFLILSIIRYHQET